MEGSESREGGRKEAIIRKKSVSYRCIPRISDAFLATSVDTTHINAVIYTEALQTKAVQSKKENNKNNN